MPLCRFSRLKRSNFLYMFFIKIVFIYHSFLETYFIMKNFDERHATVNCHFGGLFCSSLNRHIWWFFDLLKGGAIYIYIYCLRYSRNQDRVCVNGCISWKFNNLLSVFKSTRTWNGSSSGMYPLSHYFIERKWQRVLDNLQKEMVLNFQNQTQTVSISVKI